MRPFTLIVASAAASVVLQLAFGLVAPGRLTWLTGPAALQYRRAAEIDLLTVDGKPLGSELLRGEILVLDFWATWCGPCVTEIDDYNDLLSDYGARGVRLVGVALQSGTAEDVAAFAAEQGITYPVALGTHQLWSRFAPTWGLPTTLLIDRDWRVRRLWTGAGGSKMHQLRASLDDLLQEAPPVRAPDS